MAEARDGFEIEREIYLTQWNNIRDHWSQTVSAVRYLSTLVALAVFPLKYLRVEQTGKVVIGVAPDVEVFLKIFVIVIIFLMGLMTFLYQYNHHARSRAARKVVVALERKWGLYDDKDRFRFQEDNTKYAYSHFAGGECRLTHAVIVFCYIVLITVTGIGFVIFA